MGDLTRAPLAGAAFAFFFAGSFVDAGAAVAFFAFADCVSVSAAPVRTTTTPNDDQHRVIRFCFGSDPLM